MDASSEEKSNIIKFPKDPIRLIEKPSVHSEEDEDCIPPQQVLDSVKETNPTWVLVLTLDKDNKFTIYSSHDDIMECHYYLTRACKFFMSDEDPEDDHDEIDSRS